MKLIKEKGLNKNKKFAYPVSSKQGKMKYLLKKMDYEKEKKDFKEYIDNLVDKKDLDEILDNLLFQQSKKSKFEKHCLNSKAIIGYHDFNDRILNGFCVALAGIGVGFISQVVPRMMRIDEFSMQTIENFLNNPEIQDIMQQLNVDNYKQLERSVEFLESNIETGVMGYTSEQIQQIVQTYDLYHNECVNTIMHTITDNIWQVPLITGAIFTVGYAVAPVFYNYAINGKARNYYEQKEELLQSKIDIINEQKNKLDESSLSV